MSGVSEAEVEAAARVMADLCDTSIIEAPKLPWPCWMGSARAILVAAAQVRAQAPPTADIMAFADRELLASTMMRHGFVTGHGDAIADLIGELDAQLTKQRPEFIDSRVCKGTIGDGEGLRPAPSRQEPQS